MPFYTRLRSRESDSTVTLETEQRTTKKLLALRRALADHIAAAPLPDGTAAPEDSSRLLRLATWNLREFDSASYGYRSQEAQSYIAEIIAHFDLVALQEICKDLGALEEIRQLLGSDWAFIAADVTEGDAGNEERMVFLFNCSKVSFGNVAGELTLPHGQQVTDPFGDRFRIEGGARLELPSGQTIASETNLKTSTLVSGDTKLKQDVGIALPHGTKVVLPHGASMRFAENAHVPINGMAVSTSRPPRLRRSRSPRRSCCLRIP